MGKDIRRFKFNGRDALALPAERSAFATLQDWLDRIASELNLPPRTRTHLLIASDEIFTNIASYGYPSGGGTAKVSVDFDMDVQLLKLTFTDTGIAYNPLAAEEPDLSSPAAERSIGGLGILMVKKLMDSVEYRRENNQNILVMTKKISRDNHQ